MLLLALPLPLAAAEHPVEAARAVVTAVRRAAERESRRASRLRYDDLTALYVSAAAAVARPFPDEQAVAGFLIGLGVALDDSRLLRDNPLTSSLVRRVENDEERRQRLAVLGKPTMRARRDLCQHFVVSCALTALLGESLAELAGLTKETRDMVAGTGFSFADMTANLSGIRLATRLKTGDVDLATIEKSFRVSRFMPAIYGLAEGLRKEDFERSHGSTADPRFLKEMEGIRERVRRLDPKP